MSHAHNHGHSHPHKAKNWNFAFAVGIILNFTFVLIEAGYGYLSHSLALMADAGHNLSDVLALVLSFGAIILARKKPSQKFTYGYGGSTILASLANAIILLIAVGAIFLEAIQRFQNPEVINSNIVIWVAGIGIFINGLTALLFFSKENSDLNIQSAFLHMLADALISAGVVVSAIIMQKTSWLWLDPIVSIIICLLIVWSTWRLLTDSLSLALNAVPTHIKTEDVKNFLEKIPEINHVHHLHIWALSTTDVALTAHLVTPSGHPGDDFLKNISEQLKNNFHIEHATLQIELGKSSEPCGSQYHK